MSVSLFSKPAEGTVIVHDVDGNTKEVLIKDLRLRVSVYGILIENGKVLTQWNPIIKRYNLPGGGVELGERLEQSLKREFKEETGLEIEVSKLLEVREDFFMFRDEYAQSILLFYLVEKKGGEFLQNGNGEDSEKVEFLSIEEIEKEEIDLMFKDVIKAAFS